MPNSIASSSRPVPVSKFQISPERENHSRFGRSREPPITSRSWWNAADTGQPRRGENAGSSHTAVGSTPGKSSSTQAVACVADETAVTITCLPRMRSRRLA
jgi:hypothetical protein